MLFDNVLICDDPEHAKKVAVETRGKHKEAEKAALDEPEEKRGRGSFLLFCSLEYVIIWWKCLWLREKTMLMMLKENILTWSPKPKQLKMVLTPRMVKYMMSCRPFLELQNGDEL